MRDLSLSHHWTVHTGRSISQCWSTESPCGVDIFRLGVNHLFVMYGILSVASLHLASREPVDSKKYLETAEMHHKHGIEQVRQLDWESMDTSSDALRAFSTLNLIYTLATCGPLAGLTGDSSPDKLSIGPQWIHEVRATAPKVDMCQYPTSLNEIDNTMDFAAEDDYFVRIRETFSHASDAEVYDSALLLLRRCHSHLSGPRSGHASNTTPCDMDRWYALVDFLCHLSEEYIERLHQRQPPALIILSFFGATLPLLGGSWFIKGWARSIVTTVDSILGSYWAQYTEWCRDIVALQFIEADE
ncbi:hypothetical protein BFJ69_g14764 [Fusarium oxysporum]|uniref:Uncharacterized protein n=1 Tax=Fusarium oxysporum TaxID=5507 RepID=A0A420MGI2_FUSOX|nr:hypothetical protein BFJ69_g14764 [Fusarium oxysporum]